jgi:protein-tyrosine phosphatase
MVGFSDIHTHILPNVDDGAENLTKAMEMIRMAYDDGIRTLFLTPHYKGGYKGYNVDQLRELFANIRCEALIDFPDMRLYLGSEILYQGETPERLLSKEILTMADSHYVLLEFREQTSRSRMLAGVSEVIRYGYTPIIAHVERYAVCRKDDTLIGELLDMGALFQVNAGSILGKHGFAAKRFCKRLLKAQCVHFVASDAHDCNKRPPLLKQCFLCVCKKYGTEYASRVFADNTRAVIENKMV